MQLKALTKRIYRALRRRTKIYVSIFIKQNTVPLYKQAIATDLFDPEYYQNKYGRSYNDLAAFDDYLRKSSFANINPSKKFDTEAYFRTNLDVYHAGISALGHYLKQGKEEGRNKQKETIKWQPKEQLHPIVNENWLSQKVAICLHIYYDDFIDTFAKCLEDFPINVDVFIAVKDESLLKRAKSVFEKLSSTQAVKVVISPNRGRNFGPLLVEFSEDLMKYDLLCHAHSKKSLYSGREQTQWSDYLNEYLLNDRHVVSAVLRLFDQKDELGMYYPTSFWMMPSWVHHWTCNKGFAKEHFDDWQLDIDSDFLPYPVGGMFWCRPKAVTQWLERDYQYEDFPPEPLPADGSYLHAMERVLGPLVEKNGFQQFFYDPKTSLFSKDKSFIFTNYHKPLASLTSDLLSFDILSFDIFDTLLRREYFVPDYAKLKLAKRLVSDEVVLNAEEFVKLRNESEFNVRKQKNFQGDVCITEIYQEISKQLSWSKEFADEALELEFEYDLQMIAAKGEMVDLVNSLSHEDKIIWLITDTYYTQKQIQLMLKKIGLVANYELFVSSELGFRKDNGTMWQFIKEKKDKLLGSYMHVGDNVRSDAQICGDHGFAHLHILNPYDKWLAAGFDDVLTTPLDEANILKWGPLISNFGRYPFFCES